MTSQRLAAAFTTFRDAPTPLLPEPCTPGCLGWDIFDSLDGTGLHIERCDECSTIPGDEEAGHIATFDLAHGTGIPSSARRDIATALENQSTWVNRPALCDECYSEQETGCLGGIYCPECHKAGAAFRQE